MREADVDPRTLRSVSFDGSRISIIDQTKLPNELVVLDIDSVDALIEAIASLKVRGAPAIGIAGAYGVALALNQVCDDSYGATCTPKAALRRLVPLAQRIREARPTAVNLAWAVDRMLNALKESDSQSLGALAEHARSQADAIREEDQAACLAMADNAQQFFKEQARVLTHCNTGFLCTGGIGTALGAIRVAFDRGNLSRTLACETRPLLQGARLTAWELGLFDIPFDLIVDGAAAGLIAGGEVDLVVVGADRIAANGDTANKVGTYAHALAARAAGIPFVVVAPQSTIDVSTPDRSAIEVEERAANEVSNFDGVPVRNPAFDITPGPLITAIVTETGVFQGPYDFR